VKKSTAGLSGSQKKVYLKLKRKGLSAKQAKAMARRAKK
jgi:hypothetical protein